MNRLILIGNGFDLAHGLRTGYNDFLKYYVTESLKSAERNSLFEDELWKIEKERGQRIYFDNGEKSVDDLVKLFYQRGLIELVKSKVFKTKGWQNTWNTSFQISVKSPLLLNLLENCSTEKWVDIENEFYVLLKQVLIINDPQKKTLELQLINNSMTSLISSLESYLVTLPTPDKINGYDEIVQSPINRKEIVLPHLLKEDSYPGSVLFLNFNYTSTLELYRNNRKGAIHPNSVRANYIHGQLQIKDNPMIFGFGDELDDDYNKLELDTVKGFFQYIKSFWYFKTSNYHNLIRFIESDEFQVFTLGHSCGLSDRTMLNMVFEHENCKSVKIYYYQHADGYNNYTPLTEEIARHFKNKSIMRRKIVPFDQSTPMPQASKS